MHWSLIVWVSIHVIPTRYVKGYQNIGFIVFNNILFTIEIRTNCPSCEKQRFTSWFLSNSKQKATATYCVNQGINEIRRCDYASELRFVGLDRCVAAQWLRSDENYYFKTKLFGGNDNFTRSATILRNNSTESRLKEILMLINAVYETGR